MVKAAHDEVLELPAKVLAQARVKEASGDRDGAGKQLGERVKQALRGASRSRSLSGKSR